MRYLPSVDGDLALADWYATLLRTGDLPALVPPRAYTLGGFLGFFAPPCLLLAERDGHGLTQAAWAKPWCDGASVGLWLRADLRAGLRARSRRAALPWVLTALRVFFTQWPVLVVVTRDPAQKGLYAKWGGATFAPEPVPGLLAGPAWLGWLTAEGLDRQFPMPAAPAPIPEEFYLDCGAQCPDAEPADDGEAVA